jgi:pSer/pThr/pTyr-binding forkhead associated (FHA) protein
MLAHRHNGLLGHAQAPIPTMSGWEYMLTLTLRVIQGADRGRVFAELKPPITVGREEGNTIQLNDERISRFHVKIQEDNNALVLTDLDSTNGTRVNGQDCQLRLLRYGDIIAIGRSVLLFGTRDEIASRVQESVINPAERELLNRIHESQDNDGLDLLSTGLDSSFRLLMNQATPPGIPERLTPSQLAQLAELLDYFHLRMGTVVEATKIDDKSEMIQVDGATWQLMLMLYSRLSELIRSLGEPEFTLPG